MKGVNILLTGGTGLLGAAFQRLFVDQKINFFAPNRNELDLSDRKSIQLFFARNSAENFDFIVHCAAYTAVDAAETDQENCQKLNVEALKQILEYKRPIIHFSTDYVFGNFPSHREICEDFPRFPVNHYGGTKLQAEKILESYRYPWWNIRTSWLFGNENDFIQKILKKSRSRSSEQAAENQILSVDNRQVGRPTSSKDLAAFVFRHFIKKSEPAGHYHLQNSGPATTWANLATYALQRTKWSGEIVPTPAKRDAYAADRPKNSRLKNTKIKAEMRDWRIAVDEYVRDLSGKN